MVTTCHEGCIKRFQSTESAMKKPGKHFRHEGWSIYTCSKSKKKSFHYGLPIVGGFEKDNCYFRVDWKVWNHKDHGPFDHKQNEQCWGLCIIFGFLYLQLKLLCEIQTMKLSLNKRMSRSHEFSYFVLALGVYHPWFRQFWTDFLSPTGTLSSLATYCLALKQPNAPFLLQLVSMGSICIINSPLVY